MTTQSSNVLHHGKRILLGPPIIGWTGTALRILNLAASIPVFAYGIRRENELALFAGLLWTTASVSFAIFASAGGIRRYAERNWSVELRWPKKTVSGRSESFERLFEGLLTLVYKLVTALVAITVFLGVWFSLVSDYGLLVGGGLGWIPAAILAALAALLWPVAIIAVYYFATHSS